MSNNTGRNFKKVQKLAEGLQKSPQLKLKDLSKFLDTIAANIDDCFELELFEFAKQPREHDEEGIVRYLVEVIRDGPIEKKIIALEIVYNMIADAATREKFLAHKTLALLMLLLNSTTQAPGAQVDRLKEALAVQVLRVIRYIAEHHDQLITPTEEINKAVMTLCSFAKATQTTNEQLQCAIGAAIMPFYLHGGFNKGDTWSGAPNKYMLHAVQAGKARIHREIGVHDVTLEKEIFQSPLCKVFRGTWEGHTVAVKKFSQYSLGFSWEDFYKEVGLLSIAQHPHVVKLYGAYTNNGHTEEPFIVTELLAKGDLHEYCESHFKTQPLGFPYGQLCGIATDIAKGLAYLHQLGIIHRDVKTSNFLVADDGTVKMIDFGVSRIMTTSVIMTTVGTPAFMAPEVIDGQKYTELADVYSFAMVMYETLTGKEPFVDIQSLQLAGKVLEGLRPTVPAYSLQNCSVYCAIMQQCWSADPKERLSFTQALVKLFQLKRQVAVEESKGKVIYALGAPRGASSSAGGAGNSAASASTSVNSSAPAAITRTMSPPASPAPAAVRASSSSVAAWPAPTSVSSGALALPDPNMGGDDAKRSSTDPRDYDWYFGSMPKETAVDLLMGKPVGTFLVRSSSREGCYAASVVFNDGVRHILIQPGPNGRYVVDALDNKNYNFRSIPAVVKSYSNLMLYPLRKVDMNAYATPPPYKLGDD